MPVSRIFPLRGDRPDAMRGAAPVQSERRPAPHLFLGPRRDRRGQCGEQGLRAVRPGSRSRPEGGSVNTRERPMGEPPQRGMASPSHAVGVTSRERPAEFPFEHELVGTGTPGAVTMDSAAPEGVRSPGGSPCEDPSGGGGSPPTHTSGPLPASAGDQSNPQCSPPCRARERAWGRPLSAGRPQSSPIGGSAAGHPEPCP